MQRTEDLSLLTKWPVFLQNASGNPSFVSKLAKRCEISFLLSLEFYWNLFVQTFAFYLVLHLQTLICLYMPWADLEKTTTGNMFFRPIDYQQPLEEYPDGDWRAYWLFPV